jgi:hypothetical protein
MPALEDVITANLDQSAPSAMTVLAKAARNIYGQNTLAVLGYGSCLREHELKNKMADLYVVLKTLKAMPDPVPLRLANTLLPPNVYYLEVSFAGEIIRAKYAVLTLTQFENYVRASRNNPYLWARFSQPSALLFGDETQKAALTAAIKTAMTTMLANTVPLMPQKFTALELWTEALSQTYRTEWRAEGQFRAREIVTANTGYYEQITWPVLQIAAPEVNLLPDGQFSHTPHLKTTEKCRKHWHMRRITGRLYATARLMKAAFTFKGGIDYLLWKVARHSGVKVTPTPFQRNHPILGAPSLAWKVYRLGGFR